MWCYNFSLVLLPFDNAFILCKWTFLVYVVSSFTCILLLIVISSRYGVSPFEYALGESGGSLQLAIVNAQIKWPAGPKPPYPEALHQFVTWMLQPQAAVRPFIDDIIIHVDKLISKFSQWYHITWERKGIETSDVQVDRAHSSNVHHKSRLLCRSFKYFRSKAYMKAIAVPYLNIT